MGTGLNADSYDAAQNTLAKKTSLMDFQNSGSNPLPEEELKDVNPDDVEDKFEFEWNPDDRDFTWRSAILGSLLGAVIGLSNIYLGLKIGITQGAALFATMLGGLVMKPYLKLIGGIINRNQLLGPKEHCCFQAAASAAGGLNGGLVSGVIGLFWLSRDPQVDARSKEGAFVGGAADNMVSIFLIVFGAVCFGIFMAVPYRKIFIVNQNLQFPDGLASAEIIRNMYKKGKDKAQEMLQQQKIRIMGWSFLISLCLYMLSQFFPALVTWNVFANLSSCGAGQSFEECMERPPMGMEGDEWVPKKVWPVMAYAAAWGWNIAWDPVMIGTAFIVPHYVNVWFFLGAVVAYGVVGPICLQMGEYPAGYGVDAAIGYIKEKTIMWPAILVVLASSFINVGLEYKAFDGMFSGFKAKEQPGAPKLGAFGQMKYEVKEFFKKRPDANIDRSDENTPTVIWLPMMLFFMVLSYIIYGAYFGEKYGITWWMILMTFASCIFLAIVFLQILGRTNWGLISVMGKVVVLILGAAGAPIPALLMMGNLVGQTMSQIGDLIQCYKTSYIIGASPQAQFMANIVGSAFGIFTAVGGFLLFAVASPCILEYPVTSTCTYSVPGAKAWYKLAAAFSQGFKVGTTKTSSMTPSGLYMCIALTVAALVTDVIKKVMSTRYPNFKKIQGIFPLYSVFFVPFLVPAELAVATFIGTLVKFVWGLFNKESMKAHSVSVGAGLMTGGAMGGALYAILNIAGVQKNDKIMWGL